MKDAEFIRGKVPMTKEEVRTIVLSKLTLEPDDHFFDIGAGTGSVSIEASKILTEGSVVAIEHKEEAVALIQRNIEKHNCRNIHVIQSKAPEGLEDLQQASKFFIGGSGGNLNTILDTITNQRHDFTVVVTAIVLDTMYQAYQYFKQNKIEFELIQVAVNKIDTTKKVSMLMAQNPVFILTAKRNKHE